MATVAVAREFGIRLEFGRRELSDREKKTLAGLKAEIVRIGMNGARVGFKFAERMFREYPELKDA